MLERYPDFFAAGRMVGVLKARAIPRKPGLYRYTPYRGPGHRFLINEVGDGGQVLCSCRIADKKVDFTVARIPIRGVLYISNIHEADA